MKLTKTGHGSHIACTPHAAIAVWKVLRSTDKQWMWTVDRFSSELYGYGYTRTFPDARRQAFACAAELEPDTPHNQTQNQEVNK